MGFVTSNEGSDDLGVMHQEAGIPGCPAWGGCDAGPTPDSCGGLLGYHVSGLWQQAYAADGSQGLAVIVNDTTGQPRVMGRFGDGTAVPAPIASSGAIYSLPYPGLDLLPKAISKAAASLMPHAGGWRAGAVYYRDWLRSVGAGRNPKSCKVILSWLGRL